MKKAHCFPACAAAVLALSMAAQALEPALDPLPDLTAYPTRILVDGQSVEEGAMPRYLSGMPGPRGRHFPRKTPGPIC